MIKTPADFVGNVVGASEAKTKGILAATLGKVLVIDEAYDLWGSKGSSTDPFRVAVINTIVAEVQSTPGEDRCVLLLGYEDEMREMFQNVNPGLTRRFPLDSAFVFEDFTDAEMCKIFDLKLGQQGFKITKQARKVAVEMLGRARNRPNFGNGGEVDILLNQAKINQQKRISKDKTAAVSTMEPQDFDPDFDRGQRAATNVPLLFEGTVGCDAIIAQLQGYQMTVENMKARDMDPREQIPFAFLFRGPPGTGKTTTARRMGKVYYDMGFLSTAEVVECSVTDLVGQYIGHTGPKTQKMFEQALGKVLFIDEAYRLAEGHFAKEAMDEIVDCLTKPKFAQKLVVILAGYDADINRLMSINPGLTSRFPETIVFRGMNPDECLQLLIRLLKKKKHLDVGVLDPPSAQLTQRLLVSFEKLSKSPNWASARDVQAIQKAVFGKIMKTASPSKNDIPVTEKSLLEEIDKMIVERIHRGQWNAVAGAASPDNAAPPVAGPAPANDFKSSTSTQTNVDQADVATKEPNKDHVDTPGSPPEGDAGIDDGRDNGVSDAIWFQLQKDKAAEAEREAEYNRLRKEEQELLDMIAKKAEEARQEKAKANEERLAQLEQERIEREKKRLEVERLRSLAEQKRKQEAKMQEKLKSMGVCPMGYRWIRQSSGYRCAGGSHYMSDRELGMN